MDFFEQYFGDNVPAVESDRISPFLDMANYDPAQEGFFFSNERSQGKAIANFQQIDRAINGHLTMLEKLIPVNNAWLRDTLACEDTEQVVCATIRKYNDQCDEICHERATRAELAAWDKAVRKNAGMRLGQRADLKQPAVNEEQMKLVRKAQKGGEYSNRMNNILGELRMLSEKIDTAIRRCETSLYKKNSLAVICRSYNYMVNEFRATSGDLANGVLRMKSAKPFPFERVTEVTNGTAQTE